MATEYQPASKAVEKLVANIVEEHHTTLRDAKILCVAANKQPKDKPCKLCASSPGERALGYHLRFQYDEEVYENASPAVQAALTDNALASMKGVERRSRDGEDPRMVYQPNKAIPIHPAVVQRRGAILEAWGEVSTAFKQMVLDFEGPRKRRAEEDDADENAVNG